MANTQLKVRKTERKKIGSRQPLGQSIAPARNQCWSASFVSEKLTDGGYYCVLTVVDQFTTECVALDAIPSMHGAHIATALDRAIEDCGVAPKSITLDGNEFASETLGNWADRNEVRLLFRRPVRAREKDLIESFNERLRNECLKEWFGSLGEAREGLACWRRHYNEVRPWSPLDESNPRDFGGPRQVFATPANGRK
jgi:putative transposase